MVERERIFFPGLNILRFYAALAVVYEHTAERHSYPGLSVFPNLFQPAEVLFPAGRHAVTLFFVISGFLITYLLLKERERTGTVDVRKFYVRRILRIWPLYYLAVLFAFFVMPLLFGPDHNVISASGIVFNASDPFFWAKFLGFFLLLPNIPYALWSEALPASHLWSIGVEEQFYLIWPWLVRKFYKHVGWMIYSIILIKIVATLFFLYWFKLPGHRDDLTLRFINAFLHDWRLDSMACGAFGAYLLFAQKERILKLIFHPVVKYGSAAIFIWHVMFFDTYSPGYLFLLSVDYVLVIMNIAANPKPLFRFENRVTGFLGNISYGIYVYHVFVLLAILHLFQAIGYTAVGNPLLFNIVLYSLVVTLTIIVAGLSYRFFETPFLKLKSRFAVVNSASSTTSTGSEAVDVPAPVQPAAPMA